MASCLRTGTQHWRLWCGRLACCDQNVGLLVARASRAGIEATLAASQRRLVAIGILGAVIGTLAALFLVGWHLRPLGELHQGVAKLGSGDLSARVNVRSRSLLYIYYSKYRTGNRKIQTKSTKCQ